MFTLFVDISGMPTLDLEPHEPFVVLGLCVRDQDRPEFEQGLRELVNRYEFPSDPLELHAQAFCRTISEQDRIDSFDTLSWDDRRARVLALRKAKLRAADGRISANLRKSWRTTRPFVHLTRAERSRLFEEALDVIGKSKQIVLFTEAWNKLDAFRNSGDREYLEPAMSQIVTRFDYLIDWVNMRRRRGTRPERGRLIIDEDKRSSEEAIRVLIARFISSGHPWGRLHATRERPVFRSSRTVMALQAADLCAYAVRRHVRDPSAARVHERRNLLRIFPRFDRAGPALHGARHYCWQNSCECLICTERGHHE